MRTCHGQRGSVLLLTLWLAAGLAAGALLAGHVVVLRYRREANRHAALCAEHAIDAGRCYVAQVLTTLASAGELPEVADYKAADIPVGECRLWLLGRSADAAAEEPVFALQDEGGRVNLNEPIPRTMLEALPGMTPELAGAIIDWRDADDELSSDGAEAETYLARTPPSNAKNAPFETVDELRQLNGAEAALLDGIDRNRNTLLEPWEKRLAEQRQERFRDVPDYGLLDLLTVHSREPNPNPAAGGQALLGRVNINTASATVLACLPGLGTDDAARLVAYREQNPDGLQTSAWLAQALGREVPEALPYVTTKSYQVTADIVAVGPAGRAFRRTRFIFDLTTGRPVVVSCRDLTHLGWPLGEALHRELVTAPGGNTL
jgi:type II secretory pathway component PulK